MSTVSRRELFKIAGIALAAAALPPGLDILSAWEASPRGRVLHLANVSDRPRGNVVGHLFPDSIVTITEQDEGWYRLGDQWVACSSVQPMLANRAAALPLHLPTPVQVTAPAATVHPFASSQSTPIERVGHGGILYAVDYLPDTIGTRGWLGVGTDSTSVIGWTSADRWRAIEADTNPSRIERVRVDRARKAITAVEQALPLAEFSYAGGQTLSPGLFRVIDKRLCASITDASERRIGVPWLIELDGRHRIHGVYWHNTFDSDSVPSAAVHLPLMAAQWLFAHTDGETVFEIA